MPTPEENQLTPGQGLTAPVCSPLVALPKDADESTVAEVRAAGYVPILTDNPDGVRVILAGSQINSSDLLMSALYGLCKSHLSSTERSEMVLELHRRLQAREI